MNRAFFKICCPLFFLFPLSSSFAQIADSLVYAEGAIINASTREPVTARISYQSLPYGNRIGTFQNSNYSFAMFDNEKYALIVEAPGFITAKYMLDPAEADTQKKVLKNIELVAGSAVDDKRAVGQVMRLDNVIFQVGRSRLSTESYPEMDLVVNMMRETPGMIIQLEGHTDYLGNEKENMKLSQSRVDAVKEYIVEKGINKNRIKTKAFGGTQPLSRDDTPEAHRLNRRVELRILKN